MSGMMDERVVELLDRKHAFVASFTQDRFLLEATRFIQWLFTEDLVRPYALQLVDGDRDHRLRSIEHRQAKSRKAYAYVTNWTAFTPMLSRLRLKCRTSVLRPT